MNTALLLVLRILSCTPLKRTAAKSSANVVEVSLKSPLPLTPAGTEVRTLQSRQLDFIILAFV